MSTEPQLHLGDCLAFLPTLPDGSVDAVVCDPPYGLEFMGKEWDRLSANFKESCGKGEWAAAHNTTRKGFDGYSPMPSYTRAGGNIRCPECGNWRDGRDPSKPDRRKGYRCVCGGARREEQRQVVSKIQEWHKQWATAVLPCLKPGGYLLAFGGTRTFHRLACALEDAGFEMRDTLCWLHGQGFPKGKTCLKPAWESILLCRKPGCGVLPLNIDECRIATDDTYSYNADRNGTTFHGEQDNRNPYSAAKAGKETIESHPGGRWPANLILDEESARLLDEQSGISTSTGGRTIKRSGGGNVGSGKASEKIVTNDDPGFGDVGGASRFFYKAKASRRERWFYCRDCATAFPPDQKDNHAHGHLDGEDRRSWQHTVSHPTQKSESLMEWLVKLISQKGEVVLDPFLGSGSTGVVCVRNGRQFIGCDKEKEYFEIARARIEHARVAPKTRSVPQPKKDQPRGTSSSSNFGLGLT